MTEPEPSESDELLKADVLGRVRVRPEHRERMLDAFEASAMSGQAFAIHHGLKVQTFASWMQKRRRKRGDYDDEGTRQRLRMPAQSIARSQSAKPCLSLIEVITRCQTNYPLPFKQKASRIWKGDLGGVGWSDLNQ